MRTAQLLLAAVGLWSLVPIRDLAAAEPASSPQGLGQLVVFDPQSGASVRLNLARYHVNVVLHPPVALVQIDQSFYNPYPQQHEGTFVFNLPEGSSVSRFAMYTTPAQLIEGELIDRTRASNIYQSIVDRKKDPAILEQIGGNLFRMRVFPIFPHDTKRILLDYTVPVIEQESGDYSFELPLMSDLEPVWDFAITGTIRGPTVAGSVRSDSHPAVKFEPSDERGLRFGLRERAYRPPTAFRVNFRQQQAEKIAVRSFVAAAPQGAKNESPIQGDQIKVERQCEFLATISPVTVGMQAIDRAAAGTPVDFLILADTSGGIANRDRLKQNVRAILKSLRPADRFRLGCVDVDYRPLTKDWVRARTADAEAAAAALDREMFLGETVFGTSFATALKSLPAEPGNRRVVVYVGDGALPPHHAPPAEVTKLLAPLFSQTHLRFCAILQDDDPAGRDLIEQLVQLSVGRMFRSGALGPKDQPVRWIESGCPESARIVAIKAEGVPPEDLFAPSAWHPGETLRVFGRRKGAGPMRLELTIERAGKPERHEWKLDLKNDPDDMFVGRLWAQRKLDQLRAREATIASDSFLTSENRAQIVALSQEWTLLTSHTAFLVLEQESDYLRYGIVRHLRHQYWKPAEAIEAIPLAPESLNSLRQIRIPRGEVTPERFADALRNARKAIENRAPQQALLFLQGVAQSRSALDSREFADLKQSADSLLVRIDLLRELGPHRGWFDRSKPIGFDGSPSTLAGYFVHRGGAPGPTSEVGLPALDRQFRPAAIEMPLDDFLEWIGKVSGLNIVLDRQTLTDEGVALDQPISLSGIRSMSMANLLHHVLKGPRLTYLIDENDLTVTTASKAGERLETRLYPIGDLIVSTRATDQSLLVDPVLDREFLASRRLEERLDRRISVDFHDTPLDTVLSVFSGELGDNLIVDTMTLQDEGVALDAPVTLKMQNVPLRKALKQILDPIQLDITVGHEAVTVTTSAKAGETLQTRVYPALGIVFEISGKLARQMNLKPPQFQNGQRGGMGMGGGMMGGGMMGGMGGGGMEGGGMGGGMMGPGGFVGGDGQDTIASTPTAVSESAESGDELPASGGAQPSDAGAGPSGDQTPQRDLFGNPAATSDPPVQRTESSRLRQTTVTSVVNMISTTIAPDSWEDLSGPGSMMFYRAASALAVRQTYAVHRELTAFLDQLRDLPPLPGGEAGYSQLTIPEVGPDDHWDFTSLMNMISVVIEPDSWEELSGPGSMMSHRPRLALAVRQTAAIHGQVREFLTMLRRTRAAARKGELWKPDEPGDKPGSFTIFHLTEFSPELKGPELPQPSEDVLSALSVIALPIAGEQIWRSTSLDGRPPQTTLLRSDRARSEYEFDGRLVRVEGNAAVVAFPGLGLVERGDWGRQIRRLVDGRLPWLPHWTGRDFAKQFHVKVGAQDGDSIQFLLELPGGTEGDRIAMTISRKDGLPTHWEGRLDGRLALALKFSNRFQVGDRSIWKTVVAEDAEGRELERWELTQYAPLAAPIGALDAGWSDYISFDQREQPGPLVPPLVKAVQALRKRDLSTADKLLTLALERQPDQPLLLFLKAVSLAQREADAHAELVDLLKRVALSGRVDLLPPIADGSMGTLEGSLRYEILLEQPVASRRPSDWDNLALAALRAGKTEESIAHLQAAIRQAGTAEDDAERERRLVRQLLQAGRTEEAVSLAKSRAEREGVAPEQVMALAEDLHRAQVSTEASELIQQALAHRDVTGERRLDFLLRRAGLESGITRWRTLLEAIAAVPAESHRRSAIVESLLAEFTSDDTADHAGLVAREARDDAVRTALWLKQADLDVAQSKPAEAAEIAWMLYESHLLPSQRIEWLMIRLYVARQDQRLIQVGEERLRAGHRIGQPLLDSLAVAWEATGRMNSSLRAQTNSRDFKPAPKRNDAPGRRGPARAGMGGMGGGFF